MEKQLRSNRKTNGYNSSKLHARRQKRQNEAAERQEKYNSLSVEEKIKLAKKRGGKKELARLRALKQAA